MKDKVFVIMKRIGKYEIDYIKPVGFLDTEKEANEAIVKLIKEHKRICDLAIHNEFNEYVQKKFFPQYKEFEFLDYMHLLNKEETDLLNKIYTSKNDSEIFKEWCRNEKGFSEEVIEATIKYNSESDFDETYYYIETINRVNNI